MRISRGLRWYEPEQTLRGYGDILPTDVANSLNTMMDNVVGALRSAVTRVRARIAIEQGVELLLPVIGGAFTSSSEAKAAVASGLNTMSAIIDRLDTTSRADVIVGDEPQEKWLIAANVVADGIRSQLQSLGEESTLNLLTATLEDAPHYFWKDVGNGIQAVAPPASFWFSKTGLILGGVALVALGVFVLPELMPLLAARRAGRALQGYRSRGRR